MGWASGSEVAERFIRAIVADGVSAETRLKVYLAFIASMEYADWDTQNEVMGIDPVFDQAMQRRGG